MRPFDGTNERNVNLDTLDRLLFAGFHVGKSIADTLLIVGRKYRTALAVAP